MKHPARLIAGVAFAALLSGIIPSAMSGGNNYAYAQNLGQRVVIGAVVDDASASVPGATVFLRNVKTKSIRSYTSGTNGRFRFAQVNMSEDFDLWAEKDGKKSGVKTVSAWDTRKEFEAELKIK
jgi:hypothetical protein